MRGAADVRPGAGKFTGGRLPVGGQRMVGASPNDHHGDVQQARAWHDLGCYHAVNLASRPTTCGGAPPGPSIGGTYLAIGLSVCCGRTGPQNRHMRKGEPSGSRVPK
jgi:hypothetical protein